MHTVHIFNVVSKCFIMPHIHYSSHMLKEQNALKIVLAVSIAGLLFSGYLSYKELFAGGCDTGCTILAPQSLLCIPVCIYGFVMYLNIVVVTTLGLTKKR